MKRPLASTLLTSKPGMSSMPTHKPTKQLLSQPILKDAFMSVSPSQEGGTKHTEITYAIYFPGHNHSLYRGGRHDYLYTGCDTTRYLAYIRVHLAQLLELLGEWRVDRENVHCAVTDGEANIIKATHLVFGRNKHMCCLAHVLNLTGQHAVEQTSEIIAKLKNIVSWFKCCVVASNEFLILSSHVNDIVLRHTSAPLTTTALKIEILKEIQELSYPLETATRDISG
ncbi:hypothetical protein PR048_025116 [Dryococelus australis]|uniref:Uncharacterized protein n=1 Tax=Dryococelus australis TaxID=614101 RepID=A0ABQ9GQJ1_9NEOP|nr:hypothetical protein PR048_025116 [Dryococelus australis]